MTPKDKALELYIKYIDAYNDRNLQVSDYKFAKLCALITVDEIIDNIVDDDKQVLNYWAEVKQEIEKL